MAVVLVSLTPICPLAISNNFSGLNYNRLQSLPTLRPDGGLVEMFQAIETALSHARRDRKTVGRLAETQLMLLAVRLVPI